MRIVFIGQAPFGRESLETLINQGEKVVGVITVEDAPNQKYPNPVKECAVEHSLALYQANYLKKAEAVNWVRNLKPDLLVLGFVTAFVPLEMIELATHGGINYHPSLLPKFRGGSAINWAIINGETETGVTIHFIDEGVDTGPILLQEKVDITSDDTVKSVYFGKLYPLGIRMIAEAVRLIREGKATPTDQDESLASFQPVISTSDTVVDWTQSTETIFNLIRGSNPSPGAVTRLGDQTCAFYDATPSDQQGEPGTVIEIAPDAFTVATGDGAITISSAKPPGQKKLAASDFVTSLNLKVGDQFTF
ncbi:MAG: methionyl-tRNA formyltransferase [Desulfofustis sp.]|nr:methionyl-tRNA formyltransferase [Desulfofustis sp.]NNF48106.1 methionyl-tRNA formyltransferase [Desulfofustis sp.]NNK57603.1 methionyl-tRNA formyltransferase [Desulfofustis sp.]